MKQVSVILPRTYFVVPDTLRGLCHGYAEEFSHYPSAPARHITVSHVIDHSHLCHMLPLINITILGFC